MKKVEVKIKLRKCQYVITSFRFFWISNPCKYAVPLEMDSSPVSIPKQVVFPAPVVRKDGIMFLPYSQKLMRDLNQRDQQKFVLMSTHVNQVFVLIFAHIILFKVEKKLYA